MRWLRRRDPNGLVYYSPLLRRGGELRVVHCMHASSDDVWQWSSGWGSMNILGRKMVTHYSAWLFLFKWFMYFSQPWLVHMHWSVFADA